MKYCLIEMYRKHRTSRFKIVNPEFELVPRDPFYIVNQKKIWSSDKIDELLACLKNVNVFDEIVSVDVNCAFKKVVDKYRSLIEKNVIKVLNKNNFEDRMRMLMKFLGDNLIKKIVMGISIGQNNNSGNRSDLRLLSVVNKYLADLGLYTRKIKIGEMISDRDYEDLDFFNDDNQSSGEEVIKKILLYPYYVEYMDEFGEKKFYHTEGRVVIGKDGD